MWQQFIISRRTLCVLRPFNRTFINALYCNELQGSEMPAIKTMPLTGPGLPAEPAGDDLESKLIVLRARLSNLRSAELHSSLASDAQAAVACKVAAIELQVDKHLLRLFDASIRQDRIDRALHLISGCVSAPACLHQRS
jgi:hypothetical protein